MEKVDQDFEVRYPQKSECMLRKWPGIARNICEYALTLKKNVFEEAGIACKSSDHPGIYKFIIGFFITYGLIKISFHFR